MIDISYEGQILIFNVFTKQEEFVSVRCSDYNTHKGYIYRYPTKAKAYDMLKSCYGDKLTNDEMNVLEVNKPANMS